MKSTSEPSALQCSEQKSKQLNMYQVYNAMRTQEKENKRTQVQSLNVTPEFLY